MNLIIFHDNQISLRGTTVALFDYAHYNEILLGNKSYIATPKNRNHHPEALAKFKKRFGNVFFYENIEELQNFADSIKATHFYAIKFGLNDGLLLRGVKNCVHAVFQVFEPHGDVYAYVSEWLSHYMTQGKYPFVPHIVHLPSPLKDLRSELGIPRNALVFGRYGGENSFDIFFAKRAIIEVARKNKNIFFLFMNTHNFLLEGRYYKKKWLNTLFSKLFYPEKTLENIIFLNGSSDNQKKADFIATCDAMLHCRIDGETFGIACGEFSICNKPVITYNAKRCTNRSHIQILGEKGVYFKSKKQLKKILLNFKPDSSKNYDAYSEKFSPERVMKKFKEVFLE